MPAQIILVVTGLWLEVAPWVLGYGGAAATSDRIAGPVMAATAFLAIFAITRMAAAGSWTASAPARSAESSDLRLHS